MHRFTDESERVGLDLEPPTFQQSPATMMAGRMAGWGGNIQGSAATYTRARVVERKKKTSRPLFRHNKPPVGKCLLTDFGADLSDFTFDGHGIHWVDETFN